MLAAAASTGKSSCKSYVSSILLAREASGRLPSDPDCKKLQPPQKTFAARSQSSLPARTWPVSVVNSITSAEDRYDIIRNPDQYYVQEKKDGSRAVLSFFKTRDDPRGVRAEVTTRGGWLFADKATAVKTAHDMIDVWGRILIPYGKEHADFDCELVGSVLHIFDYVDRDPKAHFHLRWRMVKHIFTDARLKHFNRDGIRLVRVPTITLDEFCRTFLHPSYVWTMGEFKPDIRLPLMDLDEEIRAVAKTLAVEWDVQAEQPAPGTLAGLTARHYEEHEKQNPSYKKEIIMQQRYIQSDYYFDRLMPAILAELRRHLIYQPEGVILRRKQCPYEYSVLRYKVLSTFDVVVRYLVQYDNGKIMAYLGCNADSCDTGHSGVCHPIAYQVKRIVAPASSTESEDSQQAAAEEYSLAVRGPKDCEPVFVVGERYTGWDAVRLGMSLAASSTNVPGMTDKFAIDFLRFIKTITPKVDYLARARKFVSMSGHDGPALDAALLDLLTYGAPPPTPKMTVYVVTAGRRGTAGPVEPAPDGLVLETTHLPESVTREFAVRDTRLGSRHKVHSNYLQLCKQPRAEGFFAESVVEGGTCRCTPGMEIPVAEGQGAVWDRFCYHRISNDRALVAAGPRVWQRYVSQELSSVIKPGAVLAHADATTNKQTAMN
jgi:hypothetical protein